MARPLPKHQTKKFIRRNLDDLDDYMASQVEAYHKAVPWFSRETIVKIAAKDGRILEITPNTFLRNVSAMRDLLQTDDKHFASMMKVMPALGYTSPYANERKLRAIANICNVSVKELLPAIHKNPKLLSRTPAAVGQQIQSLADLLSVDIPYAARVLLKNPSLFNIRVETAVANTKAAAGLLNIKHRIYLQAATAQPPLLYMSPTTILRNTLQASKALSIPHHDYVAIALRAPSLFYRSPEGFPKKGRAISRLMRMTGDNGPIHHLLDVFPMALTYSRARLLSRCLVVRYGLSKASARKLIVTSNRTVSELLKSHLEDTYDKSASAIISRWTSNGMLSN